MAIHSDIDYRCMSLPRDELMRLVTELLRDNDRLLETIRSLRDDLNRERYYGRGRLYGSTVVGQTRTGPAPTPSPAKVEPPAEREPVDRFMLLDVD